MIEKNLLQVFAFLLVRHDPDGFGFHPVLLAVPAVGVFLLVRCSRRPR